MDSQVHGFIFWASCETSQVGMVWAFGQPCFLNTPFPALHNEHTAAGIVYEYRVLQGREGKVLERSCRFGPSDFICLELSPECWPATA